MTLSAPTARRRLRGFLSANTTRIERGRINSAPEDAPRGPSRTGQVVLMVEFTSPEGRNWWAVGIGDNSADAIAFAQDSCPTDTTWRPIDWNDLYGE